MSATTKRHILGETPESVGPWLEAAGEPTFRAKQIFEWVYRRRAESFEAMSNLPKRLRDQLGDAFEIYTSSIARRADSADGTIKLLLAWGDGATSECVMIPDGERRTVCIGSQVGCPVGCRFCASGIDGVERNLTAGQIVEQVMRVEQICRDVDRVPDETTLHQLNNIVMMGSGEPLANYQHVMAGIRILNAAWGLHIGARKITISTVGLPKQIRKLADEGLQVNLALSAHAPNDQLRRELIPWAEQIGLAELVAACRHYFEKTGREITFEYILLAGVNDRAEHAEQLAKLVKQLRCNVNLIRYNPVSPLPFGRPTSEATTRFQAILRKSGVNAHVRKSRGMDIDAACGQLRRRAQADAQVTLTTPGARSSRDSR